ncbi:hypothetical protein BKI52_07395 [marine bacterium AO1-C]|nr:hypothetical protein BKI52_07395 [marine bacterium AO1-C]
MIGNMPYLNLNNQRTIQILYIIEALWLIYCIYCADKIIEFRSKNIYSDLYCNIISTTDALLWKRMAYGLLFSLPLQLRFLLKQSIHKDWFILLTIKLVVVYFWFWVVY